MCPKILKKIADWSQNRKRYTYVARKHKRRAAKLDGHGRARKISERNKKRKKKSDETIQNQHLNDPPYDQTDPLTHPARKRFPENSRVPHFLFIRNDDSSIVPRRIAFT